MGYWTAKLVPRVFSFSAAILENKKTLGTRLLDCKTTLSSFRPQTSLFLCAKDGGTVKVGEMSLHLSFCHISMISYTCFFPVTRPVSRDLEARVDEAYLCGKRMKAKRKAGNSPTFALPVTHFVRPTSPPFPSPSSKKRINCNTVIPRRDCKKIYYTKFWGVKKVY